MKPGCTFCGRFKGHVIHCASLTKAVQSVESLATLTALPNETLPSVEEVANDHPNVFDVATASRTQEES